MPAHHDSYSFWTRVQIVGMWIFLGPLIAILGIVDILTNGRSRSWPLGEKPVHD